MESQTVPSYLNSTDILKKAIENKCKNDPLPSAAEVIQSMNVATAVFHSILVFLTIVVLALFAEEVFYLKKNIKLSGRRHLSILQAGISPVFAVASMVGTIFPSGFIMIDFVYSVYFGFALHAFLVLMVDYFGGQQQLFLRFAGKTCVTHTGPVCCCCRCLPNFKMTKKTFSILWYATFQAAFTRPIILFFEGVFKGDNSIPIPSLVYPICLIVSMLIGMWALVIFRKASAEFLGHYRITGKFINFQAVLIISNIQPFIIKLAYRECDLPYTYLANKLLLNYQLMVVEFFLLAITTRLLYRRKSDNEQLEKIEDNTEMAGDANGNKRTTYAKQPMLPPVKKGLKNSHVTVMAGNDNQADPSIV